MTEAAEYKMDYFFMSWVQCMRLMDGVALDEGSTGCEIAPPNSEAVM